jgi:membrane protein DedA with SNARE-associated domain
MPTDRHRLTDKQALGALGAYLIFRAVTQRVGIALLGTLLRRAPWAIPLLHNSLLTMIAAGTKIRHRPAMIVATGAASVAQALVAGLVLYWAGRRFGVRLAEMAEQSKSIWKSVWNPQQVLRAHRWLEKWGVLTVIVARGFIEWMIVPVVLVAGSSRMHKAKFVSSYLAGSALFAGLTLWAGGLAGNQWPWLPHRIESLSRWILIVGLGLLALFAIAALGASRVDKRDDQPASSTTTPSQPSSENTPPTS